MTATYRRSMTFTIATGLASQPIDATHGLKMRLSDYQVRDRVPMFGLHGVISRPLPGAQHVVLMIGGDPNTSISIASNDPRHQTPNLPDGAIGFAHHQGNTILIRGGAMIELQGLGETLRKLVTDVFVQLFNQHTHPTPSGTSSPPNQQMTDVHLTGVTRAGGP